jgi:hypothetical protein
MMARIVAQTVSLEAIWVRVQVPVQSQLPESLGVAVEHYPFLNDRW